MDLIEGREGIGAPDYQTGEMSAALNQMTEGIEHDIDLTHLEQLLLAEGE